MILDLLFLGLLFVVLPIMSVRQLPMLDDVAAHRVPAYLSSIVALAVLGSLALLLGLRRFGVDGMGLTWPDTATLLVTTGALLAAAGLLLGAFWAMGRVLGLDEKPVLRDLLPETRREKRVFVGLSFAAGGGEELAYRAYAVSMVQALGLGPWAALGLACVPFSLVHVYQGGIGLARTYLLGLALGASYLITGSLWPAILAHTLIDLAGGLLLGDRLLGPREHPAAAAG